MNHPNFYFLLGTLILSVLATPSVSMGCEEPICWGSGLVPGDGATVPANLPAMAWLPTDGPLSPDATLTLRTADKNIPLTMESQRINGQAIVLARFEGVIPSTSIQASAPETCRFGPKGTPATITVGPSAPLPKSLGHLNLVSDQIGPLTVGTSMGSCSTVINARQALIQLVPSIEATPWVDAMVFNTLVDGKPYIKTESIGERAPFGASWVGRGKERVYVDCDSDRGAFQGVTPGPHTVVIQARIPGVEGVLSSDPLTVDLLCKDTQQPSPASNPDGVGWCGSRSALLLLPIGLGYRRRRARDTGGCPR